MEIGFGERGEGVGELICNARFSDSSPKFEGLKGITFSKMFSICSGGGFGGISISILSL